MMVVNVSRMLESKQIGIWNNLRRQHSATAAASFFVKNLKSVVMVTWRHRFGSVSGKVTHIYQVGDGYINAITVIIIVLRSRFWHNCVNIFIYYIMIVLIPLFYHYYCMNLHCCMKYICHDHNTY